MSVEVIGVADVSAVAGVADVSAVAGAGTGARAGAGIGVGGGDGTLNSLRKTQSATYGSVIPLWL